MRRPVRFYRPQEEYFELSNFSPHGFEADGVWWPTVEHYFQAQKFSGASCAAHRQCIRNAPSPGEAKSLGQSRHVPIRSDWEAAKVDVMRTALRLKFAMPELRELLLSTGSRHLIEASPQDRYWGEGRDGQGKNMLGRLLMELRASLQAD